MTRKKTAAKKTASKRKSPAKAKGKAAKSPSKVSKEDVLTALQGVYGYFNSYTPPGINNAKNHVEVAGTVAGVAQWLANEWGLTVEPEQTEQPVQ
jgi:hypothetical protein